MRKSLSTHGPFYLRWAALLIGGILLVDLLLAIVAERLWFQEVDYLNVYTTRLRTQGGIGLSVFCLSLGFLWLNLRHALRHVWQAPPDLEKVRYSGAMGLSLLLPIVLLLSGFISANLLYHGQILVQHWQSRFTFHELMAPAPLQVGLVPIAQILTNWQTQTSLLAIGLGLIVLLMGFPVVAIGSAALLISLAFGLVLSEQWAKVLLALNHVNFQQADPIFSQDLGFYLFTLPLWELIEFWLLGLVSLTIASVMLLYLRSGDSLSQGQFPGFTTAQQRHLHRLGGTLLLVVAIVYWINRYRLLFAPDGVVFGATYTDVTVKLPAYTLLSGLAVVLALWCFWRSGRLRDIPSNRAVDRSISYAAQMPRSTPLPAHRSSLRPALLLFGAYGILAIGSGVLLPNTVQRLVVQPNELQLEQPFLKHAIALTRSAFGLDDIDVESFNPETNLTPAALAENDLTVKNIRLWDTRPLLETNRQLQRIRTYYEFPGADLDRYSLPSETGETIQQQVLIAARELDYSGVPKAAQTWVNEHLIYTHGYGFTVSPVNVVGEGGLPDYFIQGIGQESIDPRVRNSIPIGKPRIYYGELTNTYVMTQTGVQELDYPSGSDNIYSTYDGRGGVSIGNFGRRLIFARHLHDWRMMLSDDLTEQSKLLFRRTIRQRVQTIAPFLRYDSNPYLVVVDTGNKQWQRGYDRQPTADESYLYWIIDAYTTSDRHPYSDSLGNPFNYVRNSVKVVVDAYHGSVNFYVADPQDPLIQSWQRIFPSLFQPLSDMPASLQRHIRYPQDLYRVRSNQLMTYHMTDPIVFYNREDQWREPNEIYGQAEQAVEPYYLIMKLPAETSEEFVLLRPFTPDQRNNLIAWLAARSDGNQYGRMLLYTFPKQDLVYGTEQIEARINQDPIISQQISLWNRQGSSALQGNLLVIPINQSLLYVEPLYLQAEQNQLPTLVRVIVAYGQRIVMAETLEVGLRALFESPETTAPAIVRPVPESSPSE